MSFLVPVTWVVTTSGKIHFSYVIHIESSKKKIPNIYSLAIYNANIVALGQQTKLFKMPILQDKL